MIDNSIAADAHESVTDAVCPETLSICIGFARLSPSLMKDSKVGEKLSLTSGEFRGLLRFHSGYYVSINAALFSVAKSPVSAALYLHGLLGVAVGDLDRNV